jgi:hypothetical protein
MQNIPLFGGSASKISPPALTVTSGYFPLQYLPAENLNYYLNGATQAIQEWVNLITLAGLTPGTSQQGWAAISGLIAVRPLSFFTGLIAGATGSGLLPLNNTPTFITPILGVATATTLNKVTVTQPATGATLTIADGKTLSASQSAVFQGAAGATMDLPAIVSSQLQGLLTTWVSTTSFSVGTGSVGDSTFVNSLTLLATTTKTTASWAVGSGNGGLDTGAIAASTWYAVYLIKRTDTNVVDVIYSTSGTSPTLPANYTLFRRIAWVRTNGSSQFVRWVQSARRFYWYDKNVELNTVTPANTNRILTTVQAPINTIGIFNIKAITITGGALYYDSGWTSLDDAAASATNSVASFGTAYTSATQYESVVDSSNQIYYRVSATTMTLDLLTIGFIDNL